LNPRNFNAIVRYQDGSFAVLDTIEFQKLLSSWPPNDPTITSVQPWIPGAGKEGLIYRHSYSIADDKGRLKTSTHTFKGLPTPTKKNSTNSAAEFDEDENDYNDDNDDDDDEIAKKKSGIIHKVSPNNIKVTRLVATTLCATFDAATKTLVRQIEEVNRCRVVRIWTDYFVDHNSQLWLSYFGGIVTISSDLRSISGRDKDSVIHATSAAAGRSSFLGDAGAQMEASDLERSQSIAPSPLTKKKRGQENETISQKVSQSTTDHCHSLRRLSVCRN